MNDSAARSGDLSRTGPNERVLRVGRGQSPVTGERTVDLRTYSHLDFFVAREAAAQFDVVHLTVANEDRSILRPVLRDIDWLLTSSGRVIIDVPDSMAWARFAIVTVLGRHFALESDKTRVTAKRVRVNPAHQVNNTHWTIAVVSSGNNEPRIQRLIDSVARQSIPEVELLIVGPEPQLQLPAWARNVPFTPHPRDPRFEITAKKNLVITEARHENLLIMHDRYRFADDWYARVQSLRAGWEVMAIPAATEGNPHVTLDDWVAFLPQAADGRELYRVSAHHDTYPADFRRLDHETLPYDQYSESMTVNGGAFAVKRSVFREVPLDERLHWGEIEDGDWSERLVNHGVVISLAHNARVENLPTDVHATASRTVKSVVKESVGSLRKKTRKLVFQGIDAAAKRLGQRQDMFRSRGLFANNTAIVNADDLARTPARAWPSQNTVFIRGNLERRLDVRPILEQVRQQCPQGGEVLFELATSGVGYYTRSTGIRNCEVLMYEIAIVLGDDFELKSLFCSSELSFLIHMVRARALPVHVFGRLVIPAHDSDASSPEAQAFMKRYANVHAVPHHEIRPDDTVLWVRNAARFGDPESWRDDFARAGLVVQRSIASDRLLDGNLMCTGAIWSELSGGRAMNPASWEDAQRAEVAAILRGRWPVELLSNKGVR
ncbi:MAG: glycosyltransferase family 2 protein [Gemmatimonas sp.]